MTSEQIGKLMTAILDIEPKPDEAETEIAMEDAVLFPSIYDSFVLRHYVEERLKSLGVIE